MGGKVPVRSLASRVAVARQHGEKGVREERRGQTLGKRRTVAIAVVGGEDTGEGACGLISDGGWCGGAAGKEKEVCGEGGRRAPRR